MIDPDRYERIGTALQALVADLAGQRRRNLALRRENERLKAHLEAVKRELAANHIRRSRDRVTTD